MRFGVYAPNFGEYSDPSVCIYEPHGTGTSQRPNVIRGAGVPPVLCSMSWLRGHR